MKNSKIFILILFVNSLFLGLALSVNNSVVIEESEALTQEKSILDLDPKPSTNKDWTFMVYLDADNNLEGAGIDDINEMEMVGSDSNINILVQIDRIPGYDTSNGDWRDCKRYYVTKDYSSSSIGSTEVGDLGEVNMGSSSTLSNFISWAKSNYPADNYALILWDHGSGVMWGNSPGGGLLG